MCTKDFRWHPSTSICEISRYLKCKTVGDSVIVCDEIINVLDNLSTNVTNTLPTNVWSAVSINSDNRELKYKMDCGTLHMFY